MMIPVILMITGINHPIGLKGGQLNFALYFSHLSEVINMKFITKICSIALILLIIGSATVFANDSYVTLYGFSFDINENGEAVIHDYDDRSADVVIPEKLLKAFVTEIDDYAFFNDKEITSVSFENASRLNKIGANAFSGCDNLTELNIPSSVNEIGFGAFQNCSNLESVAFESGITSLPNQLFYNCASLKRVVLPDTLEAIGNVAFANCSGLKEIEIPDSVTSIDKNAFKNCVNLCIFCNEGSAAARIAEENGWNVRIIKVFELGDSNLDGKFNIRDATIIQLAGIGRAVIPTFRGKNYADVNRDGKTNVRDVTLIQMKIAKMIDSF